MEECPTTSLRLSTTMPAAHHCPPRCTTAAAGQQCNGDRLVPRRYQAQPDRRDYSGQPNQPDQSDYSGHLDHSDGREGGCTPPVRATSARLLLLLGRRRRRRRVISADERRRGPLQLRLLRLLRLLLLLLLQRIVLLLWLLLAAVIPRIVLLLLIILLLLLLLLGIKLWPATLLQSCPTTLTVGLLLLLLLVGGFLVLSALPVMLVLPVRSVWTLQVSRLIDAQRGNHEQVSEWVSKLANG